MSENGMQRLAPEAVPEPAVISLFDPKVQSDRYDFYATLHAKCPVYHPPENQGFIKLNALRLKLLNRQKG